MDCGEKNLNILCTNIYLFINSLVRVKSNSSGNDAGWSFIFEPYWWGAGSSCTERHTCYSTCFSDCKGVKRLHIVFLHLKLF